MRPVARIAQSVEQGIENPRVLGSIPSPGTNIHKASLQSGAFSFSGYGRFLVVATRYLFAGLIPETLGTLVVTFLFMCITIKLRHRQKTGASEP